MEEPAVRAPTGFTRGNRRAQVHGLSELCPLGNKSLFLVAAVAWKCGRHACYERRQLDGGWQIVIPLPGLEKDQVLG